MLGEEGVLSFASLAVIFLGLTSLILAFLARLFRLPAYQAAALALTALAGGMYLLTDSTYLYLPLWIPDAILAGMCDILTYYLYPAAISFLLLTYADEENRQSLEMLSMGLCGAVALMAALQLLGVIQLYEVQPVLFAAALLCLTPMHVIHLNAFLKRGNRDAGRMLLTALPFLAAFLLGAADYVFHLHLPRRGIHQIGLSLTLALQLCQVLFMMKRSSEARLKTLSMEKELADSRVSIMLSQVQPHFLYNALGAIDRLCFEDPGEAHKAILMFSNYLRWNMDSLTQKTLIPFEKELEHTRQYLALEKLRFEERLAIEWEIEADEFMVPVLTLQPIVENAVRYGATKRPGGGRLSVRSEETNESFRITVRDNGPGFDPEAPFSEDRSHTGIANVRGRLQSMCGGELLIQSAPGMGTTAVIEIPKTTGA